MTELLPCPFCGGEAQMGINKESTVREYFVGCMNCHIRLYKVGYKRFYDEAEAIEAWNTRSAGTCENANLYGYSRRFECSACGYSVIAHNCEERIDEIPNYCPNCGRKVSA